PARDRRRLASRLARSRGPREHLARGVALRLLVAEAVHDLAGCRPAVIGAGDLLGAEPPLVRILKLGLERLGGLLELARVALGLLDLALELRDAPEAVVREHGRP